MLPSSRHRRTWLIVAFAFAAFAAAACGGLGDDDDRDADRSSLDAGATPEGQFIDENGVIITPDPNPPFITAGWETDFTRHTVPYNEIRSGGPPKDGIPAIDDPTFIAVDDVDFLGAEEPVMVVEIDGEARAYPLQILIWHEIVNDTVAGEPVVVTYCPLCNTALAFSRTFEGDVLDFGTTGNLRFSDLVMYDRQSETWWQQITGEAIIGTHAGKQLDFVASSIISWDDFWAAYPEGRVLSRDTGFVRSYGQNPYGGYDSSTAPFLFDGPLDDRLDATDRVVSFELNGEAAAYPFRVLENEPAVNDEVGGEPIAVFYKKGTKSALDASIIEDSRDVGAGVVFLRELDGRVLTFRAEGDAFIDDETGTRWDISGAAVEGPLAGAKLQPVVHANHLWFAWAVFRPDTKVYGP